MNTSEIKAGSKQRIKIGRNEVEVTVLEQKGNTWIVESSSGKKFPVGESRFLKDDDIETVAENLENPEAVTSEAPAVNPPETQASEKGKEKPKMSMLNAAAEILKGVSHSMSAKELIVAMEDAGLWKSPKGATPWNSVSAAISKEIRHKENPRFQKTGKGLFSLVDGA